MRHRRTAPCAVTLAAVIVPLLGGCGSGHGTPDTGDGTAPATAPHTDPTTVTEEPPDWEPDPARLPTGHDDALALARAVSAQPHDYGPGYLPQDPYEADPATMAVLGQDCVWTREPLPGEVLANLTRNSELPATSTESGPLRVMSSVTVHDSVAAADLRMAKILEEVLRCPGQQLRADERVTGLLSMGDPGGTDSPLRADDLIREGGEFTSDLYGGPYPYLWVVTRRGPVTVALAVKGTEGYDEAAVERIVTDAQELMLARVESALR